MLVAHRETLAEMEHQHQEAISTIRDAAKSEVERILAGATPPLVVDPVSAVRSKWARTSDVE